MDDVIHCKGSQGLSSQANEGEILSTNKKSTRGAVIHPRGGDGLESMDATFAPERAGTFACWDIGHLSSHIWKNLGDGSKSMDAMRRDNFWSRERLQLGNIRLFQPFQLSVLTSLKNLLHST